MHALFLDIYGILPKGPYPPCLRMADRALLAGYPRYVYKDSPKYGQQVARVMLAASFITSLSTIGLLRQDLNLSHILGIATPATEQTLVSS